jgi:hypothetical protein
MASTEENTMEHPLLGDMVVWDEAGDSANVRGLIKRYGKGPFKVIGLRLHRKGAVTICPYDISVELSESECREFSGHLFKAAGSTNMPPSYPPDTDILYGSQNQG